MKEKATSLRDSVLLEFVIVLISIQLVGTPCHSCLVDHNFSTIFVDSHTSVQHHLVSKKSAFEFLCRNNPVL